MPHQNEGTHELADPIFDEERLIAFRLRATQIRAMNQPVHTNTTTSTILTASDAANASSNHHRSRRLMTRATPLLQLRKPASPNMPRSAPKHVIGRRAASTVNKNRVVGAGHPTQIL